MDGQDLSKVKLADYRSQLGVVLQDNFLFDGTVFENIAYARPDATDEEVLRAAKISRCEDFVQRLPEKYETVVGERGVKLSGGERQRVAIARAILADPRILILDEATSSLDSENEAAIQQGLSELMKGRTTFVIAHRLSTSARPTRSWSWRTAASSSAAGTKTSSRAAAATADLYTRQYGVEANIFRNPGESEKPAEEKPAPRHRRRHDRPPPPGRLRPLGIGSRLGSEHA